jgi:hypothetical protein
MPKKRTKKDEQAAVEKLARSAVEEKAKPSRKNLPKPKKGEARSAGIGQVDGKRKRAELVGAKSLPESAKEKEVRTCENPKSGRQCSICRHPQLAEIQRDVGEGVPLVDVCSRYDGIKKSALHRHMTNHTGRPTGKRAARDSGSGSPKRRAPFSRSGDELSAEALKERALYQLECGERMMSMAEDANDARLVLASLDRTNRSLELMCKLAGILGPDVVVNVDARQQNAFVNWPTASLQALESFHAALEAGASVADACRAVQGQGNAPRVERRAFG